MPYKMSQPRVPCPSIGLGPAPGTSAIYPARYHFSTKDHVSKFPQKSRNLNCPQKRARTTITTKPSLKSSVGDNLRCRYRRILSQRVRQSWDSLSEKRPRHVKAESHRGRYTYYEPIVRFSNCIILHISWIS